MSVEAITWALSQTVKHSSAKFVLVVMANRADGDMVCWPSMADICAQTSQDRKTVMENMRRLREEGFIEDTGVRKGSTGQVVVYRLKTPENGTVKEAQKRNSTENGTVPFFPDKGPVFPMKEAQISHERGPKTGHGTVMEPSGNRHGTITRGRNEKPKTDRDALVAMPLPDWLPADAWADWVDHRIAVKSPMTERAAGLALRHLDRLRQAGNDPVQVIEQSVRSGRWTDLYPVRDQQRQAPARAGQQQRNETEHERFLRLTSEEGGQTFDMGAAR